MAVDKFTEISAERFRSIEPQYTGHTGILFPYRNYGSEYRSTKLGLWLSRELVKTQIEAAHYLPDRECTRALETSDAFFANSFIWLGLLVEADSDSVANLTVPQFMLDDYSYLVLDEKTPLRVELEERFCVRINSD